MRGRPLRALLPMVLLLGAGMPATATEVPTELAARADALARTLAGKTVRHRWVRQALTPWFAETEGRDRFLLAVVARLADADIDERPLRAITWHLDRLDPELGFATLTYELCGRWQRLWPVCVAFPTKWRRLEGHWYLVPPERLRLER